MVFDDNKVVEEIVNQLKHRSFTEYVTLVWHIGIFVVIMAYSKTILNSIAFLLKAIWKAIAGNELDSKELFGGTCWLFFFLECLIGGVIKREPNIEFLIFLSGFYCLMFGIEKGFNAWGNKSTIKIKKDNGNSEEILS